MDMIGDIGLIIGEEEWECSNENFPGRSICSTKFAGGSQGKIRFNEVTAWVIIESISDRMDDVRTQHYQDMGVDL